MMLIKSAIDAREALEADGMRAMYIPYTIKLVVMYLLYRRSDVIISSMLSNVMSYN